MAPHSSTLAWKIPWTEEPGRLQSMGSLRVGHDWATLLSLFTFTHWRRKWQPTPVFLPGESQGWGSLVGFHLWGHTESDTLQWLSSSSSRQKMARVNIDISEISELKWTAKGEFNSDDHYIYYCGHGTLIWNRIVLIVNKRVWNAILGCSLKNDRMISCSLPRQTIQYHSNPSLCPHH